MCGLIGKPMLCCIYLYSSLYGLCYASYLYLYDFGYGLAREHREWAELLIIPCHCALGPGQLLLTLAQRRGHRLDGHSCTLSTYDGDN